VTRHESRRLGVPSWIGAGGLAILGGALAGMILAVLFQPPLAAAPSVGAVTITTDPPGLSLRVDGIARGVTPLATLLPAGTHVVEVGEGERRRQHQLHVKRGADAVLHVDWLAAVTPGSGR
jgi:hypothetical protein